MRSQVHFREIIDLLNKSKQSFEAALQIRKEKLGTNHPSTKNTQNWLDNYVNKALISWF